MLQKSYLFLLLLVTVFSLNSIYSINVCGVNVDENNGFYVLDSSGNYVLAIDRQGDTFIQGSSGVSGGGSGVFEIAGTSFSFSSTDVSYSDSSQSMGSVPNSGFLVESSLGRVSQIDSSGNLRTQGLIAGEGSQGACNSDGWLYCNGGTRENRDYFCNVNGIESGVCTYSVDGSENCLTKSSVDSDGNSFNLGGFVRDFTGCNTGSCTFNDYSDYCSSTNVVVDYRDSGSGVSSSSYNCNSNNYYYCSGLTRRYVDYNCGSGSGGCVENSDLAVETCSAPGPSYGTWSCSDSTTAVRSMTTYSPSCSASGCGVSSFTGTDTDSCTGGDICRSGSGCGAPLSCALDDDGTVVSHGDSITAFSSTSVPYGDSCSDISQERSCYDGNLDGSSSYGYGSCSVDPAPVASCGSRDGNNYDSLSSTSSGLCGSGSVSNFGLSGNVWSWDCTVAGPNDVSCSANENVDGVCENSVLGSCNEGTVSGYSGGSDYTWTCEGINDGSDASCSYSESASCGSRNGNNYDSLSDTSSNLCSSGSVSNFGLSGNVWSWDCTVVGPNDVSCSANENVDGVCSSTIGQCSEGTVDDYAGAGDYTWTCLGINDGDDASCDETPAITCSGPYGEVGDTRNETLPNMGGGCTKMPSSNGYKILACDNSGNWVETTCVPDKYSMCSGVGQLPPIEYGCGSSAPQSCTLDGITKNHSDFHRFYAFDVAVNGDSCGTGANRYCDDGTFDGNTGLTHASCINGGSCGSRDGDERTTLSSTDSNLCSRGTVTGFSSNSTSWEWTCVLNSESSKTCSASKKVVDGVCSSTIGQCSKGTVDDYSGAGDYTWTCLGINDGSDASCDETPAPTCSDGVQNGDETGVDCGGSDCAACDDCRFSFDTTLSPGDYYVSEGTYATPFYWNGVAVTGNSQYTKGDFVQTYTGGGMPGLGTAYLYEICKN